ncbi:NADH-quinone oxidoreductase subunit NuoG [Aquabacterium sp. J223]|uniref:NADH-quinone oxidoreductase subunit NuoG n=1 Tax=Aquabacterium sp. J223 TaxID=2898431 RepID=UPI0021ADBD08|nr:NADH-quinone oxidoreductase subunit NuoG [Aquabacterium sp. J223]UUX94156.1 NADH-quinone oxidoreductase subunit NuoG [Aquabacterium sp. J223]
MAIEIELDGQKVEVPEGSMVMHAADKAGTYIPHFCYHKKLSIAANCRMCLVDVEKAPKPMPACATPVTQGMIVRTKSDKAIKAQQGVMEFLLINHPLDCPICDQGGECQLQDLAVGYGGSSSRYAEEKRVVFHKDLGPLVSAAEMTRCIHCTRCVRFGQEIAGVMELGMLHRGEHSEITTFVGQTVDSELSGNMIDLCPVGALTSKPFRYQARTWELSRRKSVSPHDSTGANLVVQVKGGRVMRVLPLENEDVNECWLADRDRFSYEALNAPERLTAPMIKQGGEWKTVDWTTALEFVANGLKQIAAEHGPQSIGALASPHSTLEELHLLAEFTRGLGSDNLDHRLRQSDPALKGIQWLGQPIAALSQLDRAFVIGSFLRKDHPLFAQRLRQAARRGAQVHSLHALHDDWLMPMASSQAVPPSGWLAVLADVAAAVAAERGTSAPVAGGEASDAARAVARSLLGGRRKAVLLGNAVLQHPQAAALVALARWIGEQCDAPVGAFGDAANAVGAQLLGVMPQRDGLAAAQMLAADGATPKAFVLLGVEPAFDVADPAAARSALQRAEMVVLLTPFADAALDVADVLLPVSPFSETAGSFVNAEGRVQSFHGVVKPLGETRPGWKVLRVLGNLLGLPGFAQESAEDVRAEALKRIGDIGQRLAPTAAPALPAAAQRPQAAALERIADVPLYQADALVRRSPPLQATADARSARVVRVAAADWDRLGLGAATRVRVGQGGASVVLPAVRDERLAAGVVRVPAATAETAQLGPMFGPVTVEAAA